MDNEPNSRSARREAERAANNPLSKVRMPNLNPKGGGPKFDKVRVRNTILAVVAVIVLAVGVMFGIAYNTTKNAVDDAYQSTGLKKARDVSDVLSDGKPFSILLLGTDTGELGRDYKGRTDSLMLVTVNPKKDKVTIMSLPRDSVIAPVGYEDEFPQKLNSAYEFGSAKTTIQTIQDWLNVPIDFYALVNMGGMEKVINELDGVKVKSPLTFAYNPYTAHDDAGYLFSFKKGSSTYTFTAQDGVTHTYHKMDGKAALAFSRMRYDDPQGDYGRQERQRMVLEAIVDKAQSNPTKLVNAKFLDTLSDSTKTDLTFGDMTTIISKYLSAAKNIKTDHAQGTEVTLSSGSSELISPKEKQRVTNVLRKSLGLKHKKTGNLYGGEVTAATLLANGLVTTGASDIDDSESDDSSTATDTDATTGPTAYGTGTTVVSTGATTNYYGQ